MMESSFTFARVRGIAIGAHWTWLLVFALFVYSIGLRLLPAAVPGLSGGAYLALGIATTILFFASVVLHELGHAFRALAEGVRIEGITLWLFGGVARLGSMWPSAAAELRIALAGPAVTLVLIVVFYLVGRAGAALGAPQWFSAVVEYLAGVNVLLLLFNLIPALPLDGGRVLRAWLWRRRGSFRAATFSAARAGRVFGGLLAAIGLLGVFTGGGVPGGLWLVFLGWFLSQAAQGEVSLATLRHAFQGVRVRDLMTPDPEVVAAETSVEEFLGEVVRRRAHPVYPVASNGTPVGLVTLDALGRVPHAERATTPIRAVMVSKEDASFVAPDTDMMEAFDALQQPPRRLVVEDDGRLAGILSVGDAIRHLQLSEVREPPAEAPARRSGVVVWIVVAAIMAIGLGYLYHPPVLVLRPGPSLDVSDDITIRGTSVTDVNGSYLLTSVQVVQPNGLGVALAAFDPDQQVVARSQVVPPGVDPERFSRQQRALFRESRMVAAAAAAEAVGGDVQLTGSGLIVRQVVGGSPADGKLRQGDVIVAVDGQDVDIPSDLQEPVRARPPGTPFVLRVQRGGRTIDVRLMSAEVRFGDQQIVGFGVVLETRDLDVDLPFEISFRQRDIGGPSAGLSYALAIADLLDDEDYAQGRVVAATGEIASDGSVGPIGGLPEKTVAVEEAGADVFFVPATQLGQVEETDVEVRGVRDLAEALAALENTAS